MYNFTVGQAILVRDHASQMWTMDVYKGVRPFDNGFRVVGSTVSWTMAVPLTPETAHLEGTALSADTPAPVATPESKEPESHAPESKNQTSRARGIREGDLVLCRNESCAKWVLEVFDRCFCLEDKPYFCLRGAYSQCVPLKGHEAYFNTALEINDINTQLMAHAHKKLHLSLEGITPGTVVLARDHYNECWKLDIFSEYDETNVVNIYPYACLSNRYTMCVPYTGHEGYLHTDTAIRVEVDPEALVMVRDSESMAWTPVQLVQVTDTRDGRYLTNHLRWNHCAPYDATLVGKKYPSAYVVSGIKPTAAPEVEEKDNAPEDKENSSATPCELRVFQRVLGRDNTESYWNPDIFLNYNAGDSYPFVCARDRWSTCIPYDGNEHLAHTTNSPE